MTKRQKDKQTIGQKDNMTKRQYDKKTKIRKDKKKRLQKDKKSLILWIVVWPKMSPAVLSGSSCRLPLKAGRARRWPGQTWKKQFGVAKKF